MNEAETRAEHIDLALAAAGWGVVPGSRIRREYPITLGRLEGHGRRAKASAGDPPLDSSPGRRQCMLGSVESSAPKGHNRPAQGNALGERDRHPGRCPGLVC